MAALLTARRQNLAASHRFHAGAEAVRLVATPDLRLKRTLGQRMLLWGAARGAPWKQLVYATRQGGSSNPRVCGYGREKGPPPLAPGESANILRKKRAAHLLGIGIELARFFFARDYPNIFWNRGAKRRGHFAHALARQTVGREHLACAEGK